MLFIVGIFMFFMLVVLHEYGHFLVAKKNGIEVEEFGIGFPPKIIGKTFGRGIFRSFYTINLLPLGGFVRLKGENDSDSRKGSFGAAPLKVKIKVMMAGVGMNFIVAAILFTILAWVGMPKLVDNQFTVASDTSSVSNKVIAGTVEEDSPAARAGVEASDEIVSFAGTELDNAQQLFDLTKSNAGQTVPVEYVHDNGEAIQADVTLNEENTDQGYFGVVPGDLTLERSTWSAPVTGVVLTAQFSWLTLQGLGNLIVDLFSGNAGQAADSVAGPVGIFVILRDSTLIGAQYLVFLIAIISLTLGVFNTLPIPALDGGRLFVTLLFRAIKKPLTPKLEQTIHGTGMIVLLILVALVTVVDVRRFF